MINHRVSSHDKEYFKFVGIHCKGCKSIIEEKINNIEGIRKIEINYITNIMMVEFDVNLITKQEIPQILSPGCRFFKLGSKF